jgi:membrane protease YdiL (CAAX protease family)
MKRWPVLSFLVVGFLLSWALWVPTLLTARGVIQFPMPPMRALITGAFGPCLAAILVTVFVGGREGLRQMFERFLVWRAGAFWYLAALCLPAWISLLTTVIHTMLGGDAPDFANPPIRAAELPAWLQGWSPWALLAPVFLQNLIANSTLGEELAWRGFALDRLQQRFRPLVASVLIGCLWTVWFLPIGLVDSGPQALLWRVLGAIPAAVLATWIYNGSGRSLLLVVVFNNAVKLTDLFVTPSLTLPAVPIAAYWLTAAAVLALEGPNLCHKPVVPSTQAADETGATGSVAQPS